MTSSVLPFDTLSIDEAAALVGRHRNTVRRWIISGWLPAVKVGRDWYIRRSDLEGLFTPPPSGLPDDAA